MPEIKQIGNLIYEIRGQKVMLDSHLAELYQVQTKVLNQAVKRNISRFPDDFMFQFTKDEWQFLRSQFVTLENTIIKVLNNLTASSKPKMKKIGFMPEKD